MSLVIVAIKVEGNILEKLVREGLKKGPVLVVFTTVLNKWLKCAILLRVLSLQSHCSIVSLAQSSATAISCLSAFIKGFHK